MDGFAISDAPALAAGVRLRYAAHMSLNVTLALAATFLTLGLFAGWRGARAPNPHAGPRMIPWRLIMLLSAAAVMLMLAHLLNLAGVTTGRRGI